MSVVRRDQGTHGYRVFFPPFYTRLVIDLLIRLLRESIPARLL